MGLNVPSIFPYFCSDVEEQAPTRSLICSPFTEKSSSKVSLCSAMLVKGPFSVLEPSLVYFNIFDFKTRLEDNIPNFVLFLRSHGHLRPL